MPLGEVVVQGGGRLDRVELNVPTVLSSGKRTWQVFIPILSILTMKAIKEKRGKRSTNVEIARLHSQLERRDAVIEILRRAYLKDVIVVKEELFHQAKMGANYTMDPALVNAVPSADLRDGFPLFAPAECVLKVNPCKQCGGTLELVHTETGRYNKLLGEHKELQQILKLKNKTNFDQGKAVERAEERVEVQQRSIKDAAKEQALLMQQFAVLKKAHDEAKLIVKESKLKLKDYTVLKKANAALQEAQARVLKNVDEKARQGKKQGEELMLKTSKLEDSKTLVSKLRATLKETESEKQRQTTRSETAEAICQQQEKTIQLQTHDIGDKDAKIERLILQAESAREAELELIQKVNGMEHDFKEKMEQEEQTQQDLENKIDDLREGERDLKKSIKEKERAMEKERSQHEREKARFDGKLEAAKKKGQQEVEELKRQQAEETIKQQQIRDDAAALANEVAASANEVAASADDIEDLFSMEDQEQGDMCTAEEAEDAKAKADEREQRLTKLMKEKQKLVSELLELQNAMDDVKEENSGYLSQLSRFASRDKINAQKVKQLESKLEVMIHQNLEVADGKVEGSVLAEYQTAFERLPELEEQVEDLAQKLKLESSRSLRCEILLEKVMKFGRVSTPPPMPEEEELFGDDEREQRYKARAKMYFEQTHLAIEAWSQLRTLSESLRAELDTTNSRLVATEKTAERDIRRVQNQVRELKKQLAEGEDEKEDRVDTFKSELAKLNRQLQKQAGEFKGELAARVEYDVLTREECRTITAQRDKERQNVEALKQEAVLALQEIGDQKDRIRHLLTKYSEEKSNFEKHVQEERRLKETKISVSVQVGKETAEMGVQANRWDPQSVKISLRQKNTMATYPELFASVVRTGKGSRTRQMAAPGTKVSVQALIGDGAFDAASGQFGPTYTANYINGHPSYALAFLLPFSLWITVSSPMCM
jgi:hypothetical protein